MNLWKMQRARRAAPAAACGAIAALSGALVIAQLATGDPTIGPAPHRQRRIVIRLLAS
ncbi:MAG TPA: hypothetical protein VN969_05155 [Streptosporangiaceae bacterium]|nr:hypothetical protein [Streptosporangiaceae bacterium]